jgi:hypothetical protein
MYIRPLIIETNSWLWALALAVLTWAQVLIWWKQAWHLLLVVKLHATPHKASETFF